MRRCSPELRPPSLRPFFCASCPVQLRAAEEARAALESCCLRESQRRARALSMQSSPERGLLSQGGTAAPGPRPEQKSPESGDMSISCPMESPSFPPRLPQPGPGSDLTAPINYPVFSSSPCPQRWLLSRDSFLCPLQQTERSGSRRHR